MSVEVLQDSLQLRHPPSQVALHLLDGQRLHEEKADVENKVMALHLAPHFPQQTQKFLLPGLGDLVDAARGAATLLFGGDLCDESFLGQFAQGKVEGLYQMNQSRPLRSRAFTQPWPARVTRPMFVAGGQQRNAWPKKAARKAVSERGTSGKRRAR
jgi:hypothetical protein